MIPRIELPIATMRTYRRSCGGGHYDEYKQWTCPECEAMNEEYGDFEDVSNIVCRDCHSMVRVIYRRMSHLRARRTI